MSEDIWTVMRFRVPRVLMADGIAERAWSNRDAVCRSIPDVAPFNDPTALLTPLAAAIEEVVPDELDIEDVAGNPNVIDVFIRGTQNYGMGGSDVEALMEALDAAECPYWFNDEAKYEFTGTWSRSCPVHGHTYGDCLGDYGEPGIDRGRVRLTEQLARVWAGVCSAWGVTVAPDTLTLTAIRAHLDMSAPTDACVEACPWDDAPDHLTLGAAVLAEAAAFAATLVEVSA